MSSTSRAFYSPHFSISIGSQRVDTSSFFTANIRNRNTRRAYARAVREFAAWCERNDVSELQDIEPVHVAAYVESLQDRLKSPSIKLQLAAIRMLFDWLVVGQIVATNPAGSVRGPRYSVKKGKTPVLAADEARALLDSIDPGTVVGLRDRALIALMIFTFARVGAAAERSSMSTASSLSARSWPSPVGLRPSKQTSPSSRKADQVERAERRRRGGLAAVAAVLENCDVAGTRLTEVLAKLPGYRVKLFLTAVQLVPSRSLVPNSARS